MDTKPSPREFNQEDRAFMSTLNESQKRRYVATQAMACGCHGVRKVSKFFGVNPKTVYAGIKECREDYRSDHGKVRRNGGGRKRKLDQHPEWIDVFKRVVEPHTAGLPQDEDVIWISITVPEITAKMNAEGSPVTDYIVRQISKKLKFHQRSFIKGATLKDIPNRDEQFKVIEEVKAKCMEAGIPVISIDTKKKELIGNFKRPGQVLTNGLPRCYDHDFETFADAKIVPHGIYDIARNIGYLTIGCDHDTSEFVCANLERVWEEHLRDIYPEAKTIAVLCDGGGSNSSSHRIVKQDFMNLANRIGMNIMVIHYPPYCSKFNPIEHRLFSHITRSWSGAPLTSIENAASRAELTTTKTGLKVHVRIDKNAYETGRKVDKDYYQRVSNQVVFKQDLPKWNYLIKSS